MNDRRVTKRYAGLATAVLLLALIGYVGYVIYPRFALHEAANAGLLLLAVMAGIASLFSPCSFPLLLTLLVRESTESGRLLRTAFAFIIGASLLLLLTGAAIAVGAGKWIENVTFTSVAGRTLRLVTGLVLISFGYWQFRGKSLNMSWLNRIMQPLWNKQAQLRRQRTTLSYRLYGFGYILAGFG